MNQMKFKILALILATASFSEAQAGNQDLHTENNEIVCQMNDFLTSKIFVDSDYELDGKLGELNSKILEMPTKNAYGNKGKLFQVKLVKVIRVRCLGCKDTQTILYKSEGIDDIINKLEVTESAAKLTRNVDENGEPLEPSFVDQGACQANEVY